MKFSIVTPNFNREDTIAHTIESVLNQEGNFDLQYIIIDGASTDGSIEIVKNYEEKIKKGEIKIKFNSLDFKWISEKDSGMYDAIAKGLDMSNGDVMAWINADDYYLPGAFQAVTEILEQYPNINWLKGITNTVKIDGTTVPGRAKGYKQKYIQKGLYGPRTYGYFIQQDSVFWKRDLWNRINKEEFRNYKFAGDFRLWQMFAQFSPLVTFDKQVSCFRKRVDQKSAQFDKYTDEMMKTVKFSFFDKYILRPIFRLENHLRLNILNPQYIILDAKTNKWRFKFNN